MCVCVWHLTSSVWGAAQRNERSPFFPLSHFIRSIQRFPEYILKSLDGCAFRYREVADAATSVDIDRDLR